MCGYYLLVVTFGPEVASPQPVSPSPPLLASRGPRTGVLFACGDDEGREREASISMKKFASVAGTSITLVVALVMLFTSLAALVLANSLRSQLEETQGQLQDTQSELEQMQAAMDRQQKTAKGGIGPAAKQPDPVNKSQSQDSTTSRSQAPKSLTPEGQNQQRMVLLGMQENENSSFPYLLLLALGLMVLASLALVVLSGLTLLFGGSRPGRSGPGAVTPFHTETSNLAPASPLEDGRWMKLVEECVGVVDEIDEHMGSFDVPRREVAGHVMLRLEEILGRSGVEIISNDAIFERTRHKPDADHSAADDGAVVRETLSPGFAVGPRVIRRARVRLE